MRKLMCANLSRLWKDKIFWAGMLIMLVYAAANALNTCRMAAGSAAEYGLDSCYYAAAPVLGIFVAVFASMFIGTEYSDGTLRNKIIVGHGRARVYLANLFTCFIAAAMILAVGFTGALVGIPELGLWKMNAAGVMSYHAIAFLMAAAYCAIFCAAGMLIESRALSAVLCILAAFALIIVGSLIYNRLGEPEMTSQMVLTENGVEVGEPEPNPYYVSGAKRHVYEFLMDFLPGSHGVLLVDLGVASPGRMILSSVFIVIAATISGMLAFRRKDLK